jgi:hypothetical protein
LSAPLFVGVFAAVPGLGLSGLGVKIGGAGVRRRLIQVRLRVVRICVLGGAPLGLQLVCTRALLAF